MYLYVHYVCLWNPKILSILGFWLCFTPGRVKSLWQTHVIVKYIKFHFKPLQFITVNTFFYTPIIRPNAHRIAKHLTFYIVPLIRVKEAIHHLTKRQSLVSPGLKMNKLFDYENILCSLLLEVGKIWNAFIFDGNWIKSSYLRRITQWVY